MNARSKPFLAAVAVLALCGVLAATAFARSDKQAVAAGAKWIKNHRGSYSATGFKADAINALAAARLRKAGIKKSTDDWFVENLEKEAEVYVSTAGAAGKTALAAAVAGKNPRCFGPAGGTKINLIEQINSFYKSGKYGVTSFDQGFAMLGLAAAGENIPTKARKLVLARRGARGWNFTLTKGSGDDIESTALMIEALRADGLSKKNKSLNAAFKWIYFQRNTTGGYGPGGNAEATQANTTAYALRAADALGKHLKDARMELRNLQKPNGEFNTTAGVTAGAPGLATSDATIALAGFHHPVIRHKRKSC